MVRLLALSRNRRYYSTRRLVDAAKDRGHTMDVLDPLKLDLYVEPEGPRIYNGARKVGRYDVVIPRIGAGSSNYGLAVVHHFEMAGMGVLNRSSAIARSRDKLRSMQLLMRHHVDIPRTIFARSPKQLDRLIKAVGGMPVILKLTEGTQGVGVMIAESRESLEAMLETFFAIGQSIIVQEFIQESKGRDVRAFIVGDRVVAAMRRQAKVGEFRSNIHRGGTGRVIDLDPDYEKAALAAARIMGLQIAGVDLLESKDGPKVMEVNSSPGFEGLEKATELDIAGQVVDYAAEYAETWKEASQQPPLRVADR